MTFSFQLPIQNKVYDLFDTREIFEHFVVMCDSTQITYSWMQYYNNVSVDNTKET